MKLAVAFIPTGILGLTVYKVLKGFSDGNLTVILLAARASAASR